MDLSHNTVLITGGTSGIGFEIAKQFLKQGSKVIITGRNEEKLNKAKEQLNGVIAIKSDASNPDEIRDLYQQVEKNHPDLNILINNAGLMLKINLQKHDYSSLELTKEFDVNVKGPIWMVNAFLPLLKRTSNAAIINVSSGLAFVPMPISPIYCASKSALHFYTISLREQLRNTDVKVFELAPPGTKTELLGAFSKEDMKGSATMSVEHMVSAFLKGLSKNQYEIRPGQSNQLKFMSRFFPNFILKQLSKNVDGMHKT